MGKKMNFKEMTELVEQWSKKFDRIVVDIYESQDGHVLVTMNKGSQLDSKELSWLFVNFGEVVIEADGGYLNVYLFP